jgi:hypothetical protein
MRQKAEICAELFSTSSRFSRTTDKLNKDMFSVGLSDNSDSYEVSL